MRGTMTGALLCSLGLVRDELGEEEEEEEQGTLVDSLSPLFMASTEWPASLSALLGFGNEFSGRRREIQYKEFLSHGSIAQYMRRNV